MMTRIRFITIDSDARHHPFNPECPWLQEHNLITITRRFSHQSGRKIDVTIIAAWHGCMPP
jgi:hypothetical protein